MPPFALAEGVEPSIYRLNEMSVPRYHVATINQRRSKNTHFFI